MKSDPDGKRAKFPQTGSLTMLRAEHQQQHFSSLDGIIRLGCRLDGEITSQEGRRKKKVATTKSAALS